MFPGKQNLTICKQKNVTIRNTKENISDRIKIIPGRSTEMKEEMKIIEQDKNVAKPKCIFIVINNIKYVLWYL